MKRPQRQSDGYYHINGKKYQNLFGSRKQVKMFKTAYKTAGGLTESELFLNKNNRIVSLKKYKTAKKEQRLKKHGYTAKKGKFGYIVTGSLKAREQRGRRSKIASQSGGCGDGSCGGAVGAGGAAPAGDVSNAAIFKSGPANV